ncbi:autotransporter strand-loop-strand O-heptosyltransferase [Acidomonas methanolica]|uniref:autotransporter strand-loop-strand O-heptosyltransferase n=2 Tax=Acidomonas methanolica TaxID=437 RepID=UPI0038D010AC
MPDIAESAEPEGKLHQAAKETSAVSGVPKSVTENPYLLPAPMPTQEGPNGIRFDYTDGARVFVPLREGRKWRVTLTDTDSATVVYRAEVDQGLVASSKKYFVRFSLRVEDVVPGEPDRLVHAHDYDPTGRIVLIQLPVGTLGDVLAWFPYAAKFARVHPARVVCVLSEVFIPLFQNAYPDITFRTRQQAEAEGLPRRAYASYRLGLFFNDTACDHQPTDFRFVGLHKTAAYILGVSQDEERPRLVFDDESRPIEEPYVCIAAQASSQCKYWNNPHGWRDVVAFLKGRGYRVICIDREAVYGSGIVWNYMPWGVEDQTGNRPLAERARWLKHAEFFIGASSGLAWLAWAAGCPVVMISGFTHPTNEFHTPWRIINWHTCNSCWNDPTHQFDHKDFLWCPRHAGTSRQFECSRLIASEQVTRMVETLIRVKAAEVAS